MLSVVSAPARSAPSRLVRSAMAHPVQVFLNRPQGILKGRERPERHVIHGSRRTLVRLDDEPRPARFSDAPHRTAQQVRQGPGFPRVRRTGHGDVHACPLLTYMGEWWLSSVILNSGNEQ